MGKDIYRSFGTNAPFYDVKLLVFCAMIFNIPKFVSLYEGDEMLTEYIQAALRKANYKKLEDDSWFVEIPGFQGVWANGETVEECRHELCEVLEEWLILKIKDNDPIPVVDQFEIKIKEKAVA